MARSNVRNDSNSQPSSTGTELEAAQMRAEAAEEKVEKLQRRIETLESPKTTRKLELARNSTYTQADQPEALAALRQEPMIDHLLNALQEGRDIGHYGRLVFAMVAHHFLDEDTLIAWLTRDPDFSPEDAHALLHQVESRDYNPPRRERILEWQSQQEFPILPNPEDPDCGNVYRNLKFPQSVYEHIQDYQEEKVHAQDGAPMADSPR